MAEPEQTQILTPLETTFPRGEEIQIPLGQAIPDAGGDGNPVVLYELPSTNKHAVKIRSLTITNRTAAEVYVDVYLDHSDSDTYDKTTAVLWGVPVQPCRTPGKVPVLHLDDIDWGLAEDGSTIAVKCTNNAGAVVNDAVTATLFGVETKRV
jgi:hypothetical protein